MRTAPCTHPPRNPRIHHCPNLQSTFPTILCISSRRTPLYIQLGGRAPRQTHTARATSYHHRRSRLELDDASMASSASRLCLLAVALPFLLAVAAPGVDAWGGRMFFSKMTRPEAVAEADKAADTHTTAVASTEALDANSAPAAFSRPSSNRGYGLYGRPEEDERYPPAYYRRGVHRDAEKLTTTNTNVAPRHEEAAVVVPAREESSGEDEPVFPEDGSGRGRPLSYMRGGAGGKRDYGMSDTRLYQNGRYYYDVETDKYGYGYESNPVRTTARPQPEDNGSGYGRPGKHRRYGDAAGYENGGEEFDNGAAEKQNNDDDGFQDNHNGQYNNP